ncbi:MAG: Fic family protein [Nitrososphaerales archaeon]|nr:Fic family protein [Nitrososphaerales archaeon]
MHIETREVNGKKKYYLAASYRSGGKVAKVRVFLGTDLGRDEVESLAERAKPELERKVRSAKSIGDPYRTVLSSKELREITILTTKVKAKLAHLSEEDWKAFTEEFTYHTNAIEGSTVSRKEVRQVLAEQQWPEKSKEEIAETLGVAEAVNYLRHGKDPISLDLIKDLHRLVFKNSKPFAGEMRQKRGAEVSIVDSLGRVVHRGAPPSQVDSMLRSLVRWYQDNGDKYPPFVLAAVVHNQFETIHPFQDGNGRVGRLLLINILLKHKLPPLNIELENRKEYYEALRAYQTTGNLRPTLELMLKEYRRLKATLRR